MFELYGRAFSCCDGLSRRSFLRAGALGLGGLSLDGVLRAQASASDASRLSKDAAVIYIELAGGPTHFETYDPKPLAPVEYRGPLSTVATCTSGVHFSELMSEQAKVMNRLAVIRSMHHDSASHQTSSHLTQTGYYLRDRQNPDNEMPCFGSIAARTRGANSSGVPAFVSIPRKMRYGGSAYLGQGFHPFEPGGDPAKANFSVPNLSLVKGLDAERLTDRQQLVAAFDSHRRVVDNRGLSEALDRFTHQAMELVTSERARTAFDLTREDDRTREHYGRGTTGQSVLLARRLVEAGVTCVTVRVGGWDDHAQLAKRMKERAPQYDRALAALVSDLAERGMDRDVLVVAMGEFGRTPRINKTAGRDHWGSVMSVLLAGGALRMGQVIGSSSPKGETPVDAPYRPENVLAMVYRHLGISPETTFNDFAGRPRYVLERHEPIAELI